MKSLTQGAVLFIVVLLGSASADWKVSGICATGSQHPDSIDIVDGNCTPMGGDYWELIKLNPSGKSISLFYCSDQSCNDCLRIYDYPIVMFVDCTTTPKFAYSTTTNPESDVVSMLGGMVFGTADTYDNCTTSLKKSYYPANVCLSFPQYQQSQQISCTPGEQYGQFYKYSDLHCQQQTEKDSVWIGGCEEGRKYYNFCLSNAKA
jgi:hypothetical protein